MNYLENWEQLKRKLEMDEAEENFENAVEELEEEKKIVAVMFATMFNMN